MLRVSISLNKRQLAKIKRKFRRLNSLRWLQKPIKDSLWYMVDSVDKNFQAQGRPSRWAPWTPLYNLFRLSLGPPMKILQLAGSSGSRTFALALRRSVSVGKTKRYGWILGTNVSYAAQMQFGGPTGRYGESSTPARPFLLFQKKDIPVCISLFERYVNVILST